MLWFSIIILENLLPPFKIKDGVLMILEIDLILTSNVFYLNIFILREQVWI